MVSPFSGWFMPWDVHPVPVPQPDGVLRLVPLSALHELSQALPQGRFHRLLALPGSIPVTTIDADLAVVAATILRYGREPELRAVLMSPSSVQRVQEGDLPEPLPDRL